LAGVGVLSVLLAVTLRVSSAITVGLFALAAEYVLLEAAGHVATFSIVAYAAGLVVLAEILLWLRQLPSSARVDAAVVAGWARGVALIALGTIVLTVVVLAAAGLQIPGAVSGALAGAAAVVFLLALVWALGRGRRAGDERRKGP
jgi:hypothetical protein